MAPSINIVESVDALREQLADWRENGDTVAFVPTMGNLHRGHLGLAERAVELADRTVVSVFVNPTQFGEGEDFKTYPRTLDKDALLLRRSGVDSVFAPHVSEVYPFGQSGATHIHVPEVGDDLCGRYRPGHFDGVATVVCRLLFMVLPDVAVFGSKDYQQLLLLRRLVLDLSVPTRIESVDTVREADGLAMSSRNQYLDESERASAPQLYAALQHVAKQLRAGETGYESLENAAAEQLSAAGFKPDYVAIRDAATLSGPHPDCESLVVLAAAWLGGARLIDNIVVPIPGSGT
ncbi:MAG: pantoate--beta-alanine ligase [Pseudomonadota bacterium]